MASKFNFGNVLRNLKGIDISLDLANTAKNDFMNNFRQESFGSQKWAPRKSEKNIGRKLLVRTGRLRRDVSNSVTNGRRNSNLSYTLAVKNEYAEYLNDGTPNMVARQFVGMTPELNKKLLTKISQRLGTIWT